MSDAPYSYTYADAWGGKEIPKWVFLLFTAFPFTGFFGIDHLLFHSPRTAAMKGIVNILTLGSWYIYDILQHFADDEFIKSYGLSIPMLGASGLGYGLVGAGEPKEGYRKVLSLLGYVLLLFVPFGVSNFIVGDTQGGFYKIFATFLYFLLIIWTIWDIIVLVYNPNDLFTKGAPRGFPFNYVIGSYGIAPNVMTPEGLKAAEAAAAAEANKPGFFSRWSSTILGFFGLKSPADLIDDAKCTYVPPAKQTIGAAMTAGQGLIGLSAALPAIASKATETVTAFSDPEKLKELAMKGGGSGSSKPEESGALDAVFWVGTGTLLAGAGAVAAIRSLAKSPLVTRNKDDVPWKRNDSPPLPGSV